MNDNLPLSAWWLIAAVPTWLIVISPLVGVIALLVIVAGVATR